MRAGKPSMVYSHQNVASFTDNTVCVVVWRIVHHKNTGNCAGEAKTSMRHRALPKPRERGRERELVFSRRDVRVRAADCNS